MAQLEQLKFEIPKRITFDLAEFKEWCVENNTNFDELGIEFEIYKG